MTSEYTCKVCGRDISEKRMADPLWDGETCGNECYDELCRLTDDIRWPSSYNDDSWLGEADEDS